VGYEAWMLHIKQLQLQTIPDRPGCLGQKKPRLHYWRGLSTFSRNILLCGISVGEAWAPIWRMSVVTCMCSREVVELDSTHLGPFRPPVAQSIVAFYRARVRR